MRSTNTFASEILTSMNKSNGYNYRNLNHNVLIDSCFLRNGIIKIKYQGKDRPLNIFHMNKLRGIFRVYDFGDADGEDD